MKKGFTLTELLIAVSLIMLLMLAVFVNWKRQIDRGYDAKRKSDLAAIRRAFEEYYNDHNCYPPADVLNICGGAQLQPYLAAIPCDPQTKLPYKYVPLDALNLCRGYRTFASLKDLSDADITALGCNGITGCGFGAGWNYGIASTNTTVPAPGFNPNVTPTPTPAPTATPGPTATPTPTPTPGAVIIYACAPGGFCNVYGDPVGSGCPVTFTNPTCSGACSNPANRCQQ